MRRLALLLLVACDGPSTTPDAADTEPPRVVSMSPQDGTTGVPRDTVVRLMFSEPVSIPASNTQWLRYYATPGIYTGRLDYDAETSTLSITPTMPLEPEATYQLDIGSGPKGDGPRDAAGNVLVYFAATFTTGP